jgi:hypothetical protein
MRQGGNVHRVLLGKPEGKNRLEDKGVDGRMGSKCAVGRLAGDACSGFNWLGIGFGVGLL